MVEKLVQDLFIENQNGTCLWINSLKYYNFCFGFCFVHMSSQGLSKYIKTKLMLLPLAITLYEGYLKYKWRSRFSLSSLFLA